MEFEDVRKKIEWEAPRVAAAFGIKEWNIELQSDHFILTGIGEGLISMTYHWPPDGLLREGLLPRLWIGDQDAAQTCWTTGRRVGLGRPAYNELAARGLYRLGFEDEPILSQLPQLSAHEKVELRLSMPREFWPQKWLDELPEN